MEIHFFYSILNKINWKTNVDALFHFLFKSAFIWKIREMFQVAMKNKNSENLPYSYFCSNRLFTWILEP